MAATLGTLLFGFASQVVEPLPGDPTTPATTEPTTPPPTTPPPPPVTTAPAPPPATQPPATPSPTPTTTPAPPAPKITADCKSFVIDARAAVARGYRLAYGYTEAEYGEPDVAVVQELGALIGFNPSVAMRWRVQLRTADGTIAWQTSGTTTPCVAAILGFAEPVKPPIPPCGSTLADVKWPTTPGITYSYDDWYAYAHLQPGWLWAESTWYRHYAWLIKGNSVQSDLAYLPKSIILDPTGHCGGPVESPPFDADPSGPCWRGDPDAPPCPTPWSGYGPRPAGQSTGSRNGSGSGADAALPFADDMDVTSPTSGSPTTRPTTPPRSRSTSAAATPEPTTTEPPAQAQSASRFSAMSGLAVAGGATGVSMLALAGAFLIRARRPAPGGILTHDLDESPADDET